MANLPRCVMKQNTVNKYSGMEAQPHTLLASVLDNGTQVNTHGRFTRLETATDTHWLGGWSGLDGGMKMSCTVPAGCRTLSSVVIEPLAVTAPTTEPFRIQVTGLG